jgi:hypothetical protein
MIRIYKWRNLMSYPAVSHVVSSLGIDLDTADDTTLASALWQAFEIDLPLGVAYLQRQAQVVLRAGQRLLTIEDPNSPLGKQLIRLVGCDISRAVCEQRLGVAMGIYNCCSPVLAPTKAALAMTSLEQIRLQDGTLASADC